MKKLEIQHFNRIKSIIENEDNEIKHWSAIWEMIQNYKNRFGHTNLYTKLLKMESVLVNFLVKEELKYIKSL